MRQYIGARYVPVFFGEYDATRAYEPLTIVTYGLNSYTSKKSVPIGVLPTDDSYWALTGNYDGRWSELDARLDALDDEIDGVSARYPRRPYYRPESYGAKVNDPNVDCSAAIRAAILAANADGGAVLLSAGIYYCHTSINIPEHLYCVDILGAGSTYIGSTENPLGTCLYYDGDAVFIHFSSGVWRCRFEDFDIKTVTSGSTCVRFSQASSAETARSFFSAFRNVGIHFRACGVLLENAAYFDFDRCIFRAVDNTTDMNRAALRLTVNNEYVSVRNSAMSVDCISDLDGTLYNSCGVKLEDGRHNYFYNLDITDCDHAFFIIPDASGEVYFTDCDDCDTARVHNGVYVEFSSQSINALTVRNIVYTSENSLDSRNRVIKVNKTGGGDLYAVRMNAENISIRTGQNNMEYYVESNTDALFPGTAKFTFNNVEAKINYGGTRQIDPDYSTYGYTQNVTANLNDYNRSGFVPIRFAADSPNGPGYACMLLVFADSGCTVQIAIPRGINDKFAYRLYYVNTGTWSTWKQIATL